MKSARLRSQGGYTLIELLIATALGAIVLGAITSILLTTMLAANVATSRVEAGTQLRTFQLTVFDDVAFSVVPTPSGCGVQVNPCTSQPMVLTGNRVPNQAAGAPVSYTVTYTWDSGLQTVTRQVAAGPSRTIATHVTGYSWYVDSSGAHPTVVVGLTVTENTYNATYSQSQSMRFDPQVAGP